MVRESDCECKRSNSPGFNLRWNLKTGHMKQCIRLGLTGQRDERWVAPVDWLLKLRQMETYVAQMKWVHPWLFRWARRAGKRDFHPIYLGGSSQPSTKYFFPNRTLFLLYVSPPRSNLGRQSWLVACLFVCVSGIQKKIERNIRGISCRTHYFTPHRILDDFWRMLQYIWIFKHLAHTRGT